MVDDYSQRLDLAMREAKVTTTALAQALGISYQAVRKALQGGQFGTENNAKAAQVLRVNSDWLATGRGPKALQAAAPSEPPDPAVVPDEGDAEETALLDIFAQLSPSGRFALTQSARTVLASEILRDATLTDTERARLARLLGGGDSTSSKGGSKPG